MYGRTDTHQTNNCSTCTTQVVHKSQITTKPYQA